MRNVKYRISLPTLLACSLLLIVSCKSSQPSAAEPPIQQVTEVVEISATPITPPSPYIEKSPVLERMNEPLVRGAGNYAVLMSQVIAIPSQEIASPEHMNQTMDGLAQVFSPSLGPALISYGALIGVQNTEFVEGVLETARLQGIDSVVYQLYVDPNYALKIPGALSATSDIQTSWSSDIANIERSAAHIKSQSYSMQKQKLWKKKLADSRPKRLEVISQSKSIPFEPPHMTARKIAEVGTIRANDISAYTKRQQFWQSYGRTEQPNSENSKLNYIGVMQRKALTLSALEIVGANDAQSSDWVEKYMKSPQLNHCITKARLNTEQCIAAVHFKYEDAFCISEHQLKEISTCLTSNAL